MSSALIPVVDAKPRIALAAGLEVFTSPFGPNTSTPQERFDEHRLAEVFAGARPMLLGLAIAPAIHASAASVAGSPCCTRCSGKVSSDGVGFAEKSPLLGNALLQQPHEEQSQQKRERRTEQHDARAQEHRIRQNPHQSPPYQCRNRSPKKNATSAMLPRNTPNGI